MLANLRGLTYLQIYTRIILIFQCFAIPHTTVSSSNLFILDLFHHLFILFSLPFLLLSCLTEIPTNIEMSAINSSSTKPPYPGSYNNNGIHLHDEIASSRDQAVYDVIDDVLPGHNYDYVLPKQKEEIEISDMSNASTEPVNHASYNNAIQLYDELTTSANRNVDAYEVPVDIPCSGQNDNYIEVIPCEADNTEIPDMNSPSTKPVDFASYSNKTQLASSIQTSDYRPAGSEEQAYEVSVDMPSSDQNENYIEVIPYEDDNIEFNSPSTEPVDQASFSNKTQLHDDQAGYEVPVDMLSSDQNKNYIEVIPCDEDNKEMNNQTTELVDQASFSNKTQLHSGSKSEEQAAYEVPVDMLSSGQNDTFDNDTPSKDDKYEKNTDYPRYQPLELNRQTIYQELYEKMA